MLQLVYVSSATKLFTKSQLEELLRTSRTNNQAAGVTGMLLYKDGNFIQVLEGDGEKVLTLFQRISADERHFGVSVLLRQEVSDRDFPEWSMGFRDLNDPDVQRLPGYSDFLNCSLPKTSDDVGRCQKLLAVFKSRM